jgi:hypothetical protein
LCRVKSVGPAFGLGGLALVAGLVAMPLPGRAAIVTFEASGLFADGATLGGTYTVNTTTGVPISVDLTFGPPVSSDVTILDGTTTIGGDFGQFTLNNVTGPNFYPGLTFVLNAATLVGYAGGPITGTLFLDSGNLNDNTNLVSGSLAVPEPSTWAMMTLGFACLGFAGYRASRKSGAVAAA